VLLERVRTLRDLGRRIGEEPRRIPRSVARAEWERACTRLAADVRYWAAHGWGGEAHAGLLAHTTHLARLEPDHAEAAFLDAFTAAGCEPDDDDLTKLASALDNAVPDEVVDDELMDPQELFWAGATVLDETEDPADRRARAALTASGWSEREAAMIMTARRWRDAH
jgi:hypothetical protein